MPTLSTRIRAAQDELDATANELSVILDDATKIGLAPFRLAEIRAAEDSTLHAAAQLNSIIRALELANPMHQL